MAPHGRQPPALAPLPAWSTLIFSSASPSREAKVTCASCSPLRKTGISDEPRHHGRADPTAHPSLTETPSLRPRYPIAGSHQGRTHRWMPGHVQAVLLPWFTASGVKKYHFGLKLVPIPVAEPPQIGGDGSPPPPVINWRWGEAIRGKLFCIIYSLHLPGTYSQRSAI